MMRRADSFNGLIPFMSTTGHVLLHMLNEGDPDTSTTLCGRYSADRMLPPDWEVPDWIYECRVCQMTYDYREGNL